MNTARGPRASVTYADAGVSIDNGNSLVELIKPHAKSTNRSGVMGGLGGFGGLFDLKAAGYEDPVLVSGTDGVGTKLKIAHLADSHDQIGIDLVAMCVNDVLVQGAEPLFFLDYFACGKLEIHSAAEVVSGVAEGCRLAGCALIGGETAEMPSMYEAGSYDLGGFTVGAVDRGSMLPLMGDITGDAGLVLLALPSSGVHSNGFSLVRKLVELSGLSYTSPSPFKSQMHVKDSSMPVWREAGECTVADAFLTPTRIYVKSLLPLLKARHGQIKALSHITGGGLIENIPRVLPDGVAAEIDATAWDLPPVFRWLAEQGNLPPSELARTFNCGIGMVLVVPAEHSVAIQEDLRAGGEPGVCEIGKIVPRPAGTEAVVLKGTDTAWPQMKA